MHNFSHQFRLNITAPDMTWCGGNVWKSGVVRKRDPEYTELGEITAGSDDVVKVQILSVFISPLLWKRWKRILTKEGGTMRNMAEETLTPVLVSACCLLPIKRRHIYNLAVSCESKDNFLFSHNSPLFSHCSFLYFVLLNNTYFITVLCSFTVTVCEHLNSSCSSPKVLLMG